MPYVVFAEVLNYYKIFIGCCIKIDVQNMIKYVEFLNPFKQEIFKELFSHLKIGLCVPISKKSQQT